MNINLGNPLTKFLLCSIQKYNHEKYWRMRDVVVNGKKSKITRMYYLYKIKKSDGFNNASMGTDLGGGAKFETPPCLPHGLNGIIVSHHAKIGANVTIFQQVTIGQGSDGKAAIIGDNCIIGAGAKIIGGVKIGNNVKIGANCVVVKDVPDNCTVVSVAARVIDKKEQYVSVR